MTPISKIENILQTINKSPNIHYLIRYIKFISTRGGIKIKNKTHLHHILPKAKDMFPEYKNIRDNPWNGIHLTHREHFIAHWILAKTFPGTSQTLAFYYMTNSMNTVKSKDYYTARELKIKQVREMTQSPERNAKISKALKDVKKSEKHKNNLKGRKLSEASLEKLRIANIGKTRSAESINKQFATRKRNGIKPRTVECNEKMAKTKMTYNLHTPFGIFYSFTDATKFFNLGKSFILNIFRDETYKKVARKTKIIKLGLEYIKGKTWMEYDFYPLEKIT